jgi:hypothetical protein
MKINLFIALVIFGIIACNTDKSAKMSQPNQTRYYFDSMYSKVRLTSDLKVLSENEKKMIPLLIRAAKIMNEIFWIEAYGDREKLLSSIPENRLKEFAIINYGPWDRLNDNKSFIEGIGSKPAGANFYPVDMTREEFNNSQLKDKSSLYTIIRRDEKGKLKAIYYHEFFADKISESSGLLSQASELADDPGLKKYLQLRSKALLNDDYRESDIVWLDMKTNTLDLVIGPIESYEDALFGYKASHEAYVLIKDKEWSKRLEKYASYLPELQHNLPVPAEYKNEKPGSEGDLNAYDVVYYAGDCNAGSKTIAINLPNDEWVQLKKGTRRLQLKNTMKAKFELMMMPIANILIDSSQVKYVTFNAFFANTMFHEVAHGLGIKNTINNKGSVRTALKEHFAAIEEGKADILGLYMIKQLHDKGALEGNLEEYYTTFLAGIFRSVRFGASSAHGKANMIRFNFFKQMGAFDYNALTGTYRVNFEKIESAVKELSGKLLVLQGNGDFDGVAKLINDEGSVSDQLRKDLEKLEKANIPVDIEFEQGTEILGL